MPDIDTHGKRVDFGRHKGELWTRVPVGYLKWIVQQNARHADIAQAELDRRGTHTPEIDVSGHAVDRASLNCADIWKKTRAANNEGLHAWLCRISKEALDANDTDNQGRYRHRGMLFVIEGDGAWPLLKTIIRKNYQKPAARD